MRELVDYINNLTYNNGDELNMLEKVKLGNNKVFKTQDALEGLMKYSNDTITTNKKLEKLNEALPQNDARITLFQSYGLSLTNVRISNKHINNIKW